MAAVLFAVVLVTGLRFASDRTATAGIPARVSRGFYLGVWSVSGGIPLILLAVYLFSWMGSFETTPVLLLMGMAGVISAFGAVVFLVLTYKMWAAIQGSGVRTSPGRAVGFLFIPIYGFYWVFQAYWGFAKDYNAIVVRHHLDEVPRLREGLFLTYAILSLMSLIPIINLIIVPIVYILVLKMISNICDSVNALPRSIPESD